MSDECHPKGCKDTIHMVLCYKSNGPVVAKLSPVCVVTSAVFTLVCCVYTAEQQLSLPYVMHVLIYTVYKCEFSAIISPYCIEMKIQFC